MPVFAWCACAWRGLACEQVEVKERERERGERCQERVYSDPKRDRGEIGGAAWGYRTDAEMHRGCDCAGEQRESQDVPVMIGGELVTASQCREPAFVLDGGHLCDDRPSQREENSRNDQGEESEEEPNVGDDLCGRDDRENP